FPFLREADEVLNPVGEAITARLEAARAGEAPGVGLMVPRVSAPGSVSQHTRYTGLDGTVVPGELASEETEEELQRFFDRTGVEEAFFSQVVEQGPPQRAISYEVLQFRDEAEASAYIRQSAEQNATWHEDGVVDPDPPVVGDETSVVRWTATTDAGQDRYLVAANVRVGTLVTGVLINSTVEVADHEVTLPLGEAAACLNGRGCGIPRSRKSGQLPNGWLRHLSAA
ncbi:MAG: hypothetical protein ACKOCK_07455, partial [Chloroflexota bacterium]